MNRTNKTSQPGFALWIFLILFLVSVLFSFLMAAEIFLRLRDYNMRKISHEENIQLFQIAPFLQIKPRPNPDTHVNEFSFRGDPLDLSDDTFRIFTLGGSTTFSGDLDYSDTYPGKLERKLRERYPGVKIQVQNAGCDWYSTQHSIIRYLFKIRHFQPHLLIMKHAINDLFRGFSADCCSMPGARFEDSYSHYFGPIYRMAQISETAPTPPRLFVLEKTRRFLKRLSPEAHDPTDELSEFVTEYGTAENYTAKDIKHFRSLAVFEGNLRAMANLAILYESMLIFSTQPSLYRDNLTPEELETLYFGPFHMSEKGVYPSIKSLEYGMKLFNETTLAVGREQGVPVVDVDKNTPKTLEYLFDDVHPTERGLEIEAQLLFDEIVRLKIIDNWIAAGKPAPRPSAARAANPQV